MTTQKHLFSPDQLQKLVQDTFPTDAKTGEKVVLATVDSTGTKVLASFKLKEHWELQAAVSHNWDGDTQGGARMLLRW